MNYHFLHDVPAMLANPTAAATAVSVDGDISRADLMDIKYVNK
jgi:hypothetical protein